MKPRLLLAGAGVLFLGLAVGAPARRPASQGESRPAAAAQPIDFDTQIRPILERRCQPCHFAGGKMYARLPFDRPQTIRSLGEKMFTRIKNEQETALLRAFLAQEERLPAGE